MNTPVVEDTRWTVADRGPLSGGPGAHLLGTGLGAAVGGVAAGALLASVAGPVGTVVGAVVGAAAGGLAGHATSEAFNPGEHDAYWRGVRARDPYFNHGDTHEEHVPGYRIGQEPEKRTHYERHPLVRKYGTAL